MFALSNGLRVAMETNPETGATRIIRQSIAASLPADTLSRPVKYVDSMSRPAAKPFLHGPRVASVGRADFASAMARAK